LKTRKIRRTVGASPGNRRP